MDTMPEPPSGARSFAAALADRRPPRHICHERLRQHPFRADERIRVDDERILRRHFEVDQRAAGREQGHLAGSRYRRREQTLPAHPAAYTGERDIGAEVSVEREQLLGLDLQGLVVQLEHRGVLCLVGEIHHAGARAFHEGQAFAGRALAQAREHAVTSAEPRGFERDLPSYATIEPDNARMVELFSWASITRFDFSSSRMARRVAGQRELVGAGPRKRRCRLQAWCRLQRQRPILHDTFHDQRRTEALDAGQSRQTLVVERLECGQVAGEDAQEIVRITEQPLRLNHIRDRGNGSLECVEGDALRGVHRDEDKASKVRPRTFASSCAWYPLIAPSRSSVRKRRWQGEMLRRTRSASSVMVRRPSFWSSARISLSIASMWKIFPQEGLSGEVLANRFQAELPNLCCGTSRPLRPSDNV